MYLSFFSLILDLNIFIILATVPTGLQTCAKVLQTHLSGGGGTPCLQPKSNAAFKKDLLHVFKFVAAGFGFKYFHYNGHCAHKVVKLFKSVASALSRGWGDTLVATQK